MRDPAELRSSEEVRAPAEELLALPPAESLPVSVRAGDLLDVPLSPHLNARVDGSCKFVGARV